MGTPRGLTRRVSGNGEIPVSAVLLAAALLTGTVVPARALECPRPQPANTPTAIKETPQQISQYSKLVAAQGGDAVPDIVSYVKRKHPSASDAEVTNFLVTIFCPVVERNAALSEGEKRGRLEAFSSRIMRELAK